MIIPTEFLSNVFTGLATGLAATELSNAFQKQYPEPTRDNLESFLKLHGVDADAREGVINAFAKCGYLSIASSTLHGQAGASIGAGPDGRFDMTDSKVSSATSHVHAQGNASISGQGASIEVTDAGVTFNIDGGTKS